ncbi:MAG: PIN domain-containing protein [Candidatus Cloacimonetes bacterium]|nr:PIN domain-containing protein [Candidatus Cloacimonadota bacterium]
MYLIDTNIFLEILLKQNKSDSCKAFLDKNIGSINISDFTLHSIGVILFRQNEEQSFLKFISDILPKTNLLSLPKNKYDEVIIIKNKIGLDFDDSYQYNICKQFDLKFVTMDKDFKKVKDIEIQFL